MMSRHDETVVQAIGPVHVLHVIDSLSFGGGAEESLASSLVPLRMNGVQSTVVCLFDRPGWQDELRNQGFPVHVLGSRTRLGRIHELRRLIRDYEPDIVHACLIESTLLTRLASIGLPHTRLDSLVNTTYDPRRLDAHQLSRLKAMSLQGLDSFTSRWVDHFHALTQSVADDAIQHLRLHPGRITIVPRGRASISLGKCSEERRSGTRLSLGIPGGAAVVLNVGRQDPQKAKLDLVRAFEIVADHLPSAVLLIAGREGSDTKKLAQAIEMSRHASRIKILGHRVDIPDLLCAADVFAFPSLFEGLGGSLIEAMAMRCPIVASDAPAILEVLDHGNVGKVSARGDIQSLAAAIQALLTDPMERTRLAEAARLRFEEEYEFDVVLGKMCDLYARLAPSAHWPVRTRRARNLGRLSEAGSVITTTMMVFRRAPSHTNNAQLGAWDSPEDAQKPPLHVARNYTDFASILGPTPGHWRQNAAKRFAADCSFVYLCDRSAVLCGGWISPPVRAFPVNEVRRKLRLGETSRVLFDFWTRPDLRGLGLYTHLLSHTAELLGSECCFIFASKRNQGSVTAIQRSGFHHVGNIAWLGSNKGEWP